MSSIDLNVDVGEGFSQDIELLNYATSANIACGWHAGDVVTMQRITSEALRRGVAIGAHPSYPDRENFGRSPMILPPAEIYVSVQYQVGALVAIAKGLGGRLSHVKPHGALYNDAERDTDVANAIVRAVRDYDPSLAVFGLAEGQLVDAARRAGLVAFGEVFADRGYTEDGKLIPRSEPGALLESDEIACQQVLDMVLRHRVMTRGGGWACVRPETLCLHGDGDHALKFASRIQAVLIADGVRIVATKKGHHVNLDTSTRGKDLTLSS
ncbi:5-oxoprolinase subunit PxpA [Burkholderia alba]|uniref:5-oxoprolinase subunit PxpA n=1 Tax=Burkholderia alba TaxID=2683677 RepID=UPI002B054EE6|nr:5-oxoprolinase subunit PxpA [Burkholderia alba]